jgi:hypothetical protein
LVRRANVGKKIVDTFESSPIREGQVREIDEDNVPEDKIEALAELICRAADESPIALLVLMRMFENSVQPQALANTVKYLAFTRCGELNVNGMVDAQIAALEAELFAGGT